MNISDLCAQRLQEKGLADNPVYQNRLDYELRVVSELQFEPVFVICHKLIGWAKQQGIRVGAGRGSAAGSLICYLLGITGLDPIEYDLSFERFLIQGRVNPPDIDIDFQRSRRDEAYARLEQMVGPEHVAHLCTFSFMRMRAALRDVARVLEIPLPVVEQMLKSIPYEIEALKDALAIPQVAQWATRYPKLFEAAQRLENKPRHVSVHAAGVVISNQRIADLVPLQYNAGKNMLATGWDMYDCESAGLFKLDLLGLETLDVLDETLRLVRKRTGQDIDLDRLVPDDPKVLKKFSEGHTYGVFQLEKEYVSDLLIKIGADTFQDIVALNAMLRPGALVANAPEVYAERKRGKPFGYAHPLLEPILGPTYGLLIYQEQAIRIARDIAGFTVQEADVLRRAIGKKKLEDYAREKSRFIDKSIGQGIAPQTARGIWEMMSGAATYMFNKSHSTCYSYISYQTMWLKTYHPTEFFCALLNSKLSDDDELRHHISTLQQMGIQVLKPSAAESGAYFSPVSPGVIRGGFLRIKGVGTKAAQVLESLEDRGSMSAWATSMARINHRPLNKKMLNLLLDTGIFECYNVPHAEVQRYLDDLSRPRGGKKRLQELYLLDLPPVKYKELV